MAESLKNSVNSLDGRVDYTRVVLSRLEHSKVHASELDLAAPLESPGTDQDSVPKDTGWAWMCCLGCFMVQGIGTGGVLKCFSIMYVAFMEDFDAQAGKAAWIIVVCQVIFLFGASFSSVLSIQFTSKAVVFTGGLFLCTGFVASMFATTVDHLFLTYGLLLGIGCSCAITVSVSHMGMYFKDRRGVANGIAFSGVGVGSFVLPMIFRWLLDTYGLQGTLLVMGGFSSNVCVAAMLLRPISVYNTENKGNNMKDDAQKSIKQNNPTGKKASHLRHFLFWPVTLGKTIWRMYALLEWSLLKDWSFVLTEGSFFFWAAGVPTYFMSIPAYVEQVGHTKAQAAFIVSLGGLAELISRLGSGFVVDYCNVPTYVLLALLALTAAVAAAVTPVITNFMALGFAYCTFSMSVGPMMPLNAVLLGESLGVHRLPSAMGLLGFFMGFGMFFGTPVGGTLRDITGNWKMTFYYSSGMMLLCGMMLMLRPVAVRAQQKHAIYQDVPKMCTK